MKIKELNLKDKQERLDNLIVSTVDYIDSFDYAINNYPLLGDWIAGQCHYNGYCQCGIKHTTYNNGEYRLTKFFRKACLPKLKEVAFEATLSKAKIYVRKICALGDYESKEYHIIDDRHYAYYEIEEDGIVYKFHIPAGTITLDDDGAIREIEYDGVLATDYKRYYNELDTYGLPLNVINELQAVANDKRIQFMYRLTPMPDYDEEYI